MIKYQLRGLIHSGLAAIEWRMRDVMTRSKIPATKDISELKELDKLLQKYNELMTPLAQHRFTPRMQQNSQKGKA